MILIQLWIIGSICICSNCYLYTVLRNVNIKYYPENITFKLIAENTKGSFFYSNDNFKNFIDISLKHVSGGNVTIILRNNAGKKEESLFKFCGYHNYKKFELSFQLYYDDQKIYLSCNSRPSIGLQIFGRKDTTADIQIFMGYNSPFVPRNDGTTFKGCLIYLSYKNKTEDLDNHGKVQFNKCPLICTSTFCNTGICIEKYTTTNICNCTESIYNGQYCNETGTSLNGSQLFIWNETLIFQKLKFSWMHTNLTKCILLEFHTNDSTVLILSMNLGEVIWNNGSNEHILCKIRKDNQSNIIYIEKTSSQSFTFKCHNSKDTRSLKISRAVFVRINIGFSQYSSSIGYFKGILDLVYQNATHDAWIRPNLKEIEIRIIDIQGYLMEMLSRASTYAVPVLACLIIVVIVYYKLQGKREVKTKSKSFGEHIDKMETIYDELQNKMEQTSQIYDLFDYDQTDSSSYPIPQNEYMSMSPTVPPRDHLPSSDIYYPASSDHSFSP